MIYVENLRGYFKNSITGGNYIQVIFGRGVWLSTIRRGGSLDIFLWKIIQKINFGEKFKLLREGGN